MTESLVTYGQWTSRGGSGEFRRRPRPDGRFSTPADRARDRKSTRLNSSHVKISYAVFFLKKKKISTARPILNRCWLSCCLPICSYANPTSNARSNPFFFNDTATTEIYTLSLHDALPILAVLQDKVQKHIGAKEIRGDDRICKVRSEEHTSELQSRENLVCRLLLEKK